MKRTAISVDAKFYYRRLTEEQKRLIYELLDAGTYSHFQISEIVGCAEHSVTNHAYQRRKQAREREAEAETVSNFSEYINDALKAAAGGE